MKSMDPSCLLQAGARARLPGTLFGMPRQLTMTPRGGWATTASGPDLDRVLADQGRRDD